MRKPLIIAIMCFAAALAASAQVPTKIFDPSFKSVQVYYPENAYAPPIIQLGSDEYVLVSFDEMTVEHQYLRYSLVHCNADWTPSQLFDAEYVDGFNYANIDNFEYSSGTFSHFVHYSFTVPNEDMKISKSGNYLVKVYPEDDPDNILLQTGFFVCDKSISATMDVTSRTDLSYNREHQQLSAIINTLNFDVRDPYNDLFLYFTQNSRLDNQVVVDKPLMVNATEIEYDHTKNLIFTAGNEFRRIETVDVTTINMGVQRLEYIDPYYHATLEVDQPRFDSGYLYDQTQYGRFTIRNRLVDNHDTMADYIVTHFALNTEGPLEGGKIYLDGEFTNHQFTPEFMMRYDSDSGMYLTDLLLKQGAYNYQYLWVPDGSATGYTAKIEGDKYQTVNEYLLRVYYRHPGDRYDNLIGYALVFSGT